MRYNRIRWLLALFFIAVLEGQADNSNTTITLVPDTEGRWVSSNESLSLDGKWKLVAEYTDVSYIAPTAISELTYTGEFQELISAGSSEDGTMVYSLDGKYFSKDIPMAIAPGTYTVYYKLHHETGYTQVKMLTVDMSKTTSLTSNGNNVFTLAAMPEYDAKLVVEYEDIPKTDEDIPKTDFLPDGTGTWVLSAMPEYDVKLVAEYTDVSYIAPTAISGLTYTGEFQELISAGSSEDGTMVYSLGGEYFSKDIPMAIAPGTYTVYYKLHHETGYTQAKMLTVDIAKTASLTSNGNNVFTHAAMPEYDVKLVVEYERVLPEIALLDNADNSTVLTANEGLLVEATLQDRTLCKDGKWNTLTLPFDVPSLTGTPLEGATVKEIDVTGKNGLDAETGTLYLSFKTATQIEAGKPYLVKWESGTDIVEPVFTDVTITSTAPTAVVSATSGLDEVTMTGNYSPVSVAANDQSIMFMGGDNTLYYTTEDRSLRCFRAHFGIESQNKVKSFVMNFGDDVATGVSLVQSQESADDCYYDLHGRKLSGKPTKAGIYINRGRKRSVK